MPASSRIAFTALLMLAHGAAMPAEQASPLTLHPLIQSAGGMAEIPNARHMPDPAREHRIVVSLTKGASEPSKVNPGLERAARLVNMLIFAGVPAKRIHLVTVAAADAVDAHLADASYRTAHGVANPNAPVVAELIANGVEVSVCGQAWIGHGYTRAQLLPGVTLSLSQLTTIAELQAQGYALIPL